MLNYNKIMALKPYEYNKMTNSKGQEIVFCEDPIEGDEAEVIALSHDLKLASYTSFFDLEDMMADHKEYEPSFQNGKLYIGEFLND